MTKANFGNVTKARAPHLGGVQSPAWGSTQGIPKRNPTDATAGEATVASVGGAQAQKGFQSGEPGGSPQPGRKAQGGPERAQMCSEDLQKDPEEHQGSPEKEPTDATTGEATVASVGGSRFTMDSRAKSLGRVQSQAAPREPTGDCFLEPDLVWTDIDISYFHVHLHVRNRLDKGARLGESDLVYIHVCVRTQGPQVGNPSLTNPNAGNPTRGNLR